MKRILVRFTALCLTIGIAGAFAQGMDGEEQRDMTLALNDGEAVVYVAGGCFWGMEKLMSVIPGVTDAVSGYANGTVENPTYREVCTGATGHRETVRVVYRPQEVSLQAILSVYFSAIDPTVPNRQGNDHGTQYQTGVYYVNPAHEAIIRSAAETEKARHASFYVEIAPLSAFYEAESEHQDYLDAHPGGYCHIPAGLFERAARLTVDPAAYAKPTDEELKRTLTEEQYRVTQQAGTEAPYANEFWSTQEDGLYVDVTTGEPLFSSADKYQSSCGWPAFGKGLDDNALFYQRDDSHGMTRTEVRSRVGNAHLGHVFEGDGESPTGTRYCINSAALRFIPYDQMKAEGYERYLPYVRPLTPEYHLLTALQAKERMDSDPDALVLDVRTKQEYDAGHIAGALSLPLQEIGSNPPALLPDQNATLLIYCRSGRRSKEAADKLVAMGYTAAYDFGGILDWPYGVVTD